MQALQTCHDTLWTNAEKDDVRSLYKPDAQKLMEKNPGRFKHIDTWNYNPEGGIWSRSNAGLRE